MVGILFIQPSIVDKIWDETIRIPFELYVNMVLRPTERDATPDFNRVMHTKLFPRDEFYGELFCGLHTFTFMPFDDRFRIRLPPGFSPVIAKLTRKACQKLYIACNKYLVRVVIAADIQFLNSKVEYSQYFHTIFINSIPLTQLYKRGVK